MVKCAECGFLSVRHRQNRTLVEVEALTRQTGAIPRQADKVLVYENKPICFRQAFDLTRELHDDETEKSFLRVIQRDRPCDEVTQWKQGFTPKEHIEMLDRQWQLDFQRKAEKEDREWREKVRKEDLEWKSREENKTERQFRWHIIIVGIVGTIIITAGSIFGSWIQAKATRDSAVPAIPTRQPSDVSPAATPTP